MTYEIKKPRDTRHDQNKPWTKAKKKKRQKAKRTARKMEPTRFKVDKGYLNTGNTAEHNQGRGKITRHR